jgi:hypothetical protein
MRITIELRAELAHQVADIHAVMPGQSAILAGDGWSMPVSARAVAAFSGDDSEARAAWPGYILDDDAEEWAVVMVTYGGETRIANSFLPPPTWPGS